jgi:hypothetical protein
MELTVEALKEARFKGPVAFYDGRAGMARQDFVSVDEPRFGYFWQRQDRKDKGRQAYMVDGFEVADLVEAVKLLAQPPREDSPAELRRKSVDLFRESPRLGVATRALSEAECNAAVGPMGSVQAWMERVSHPWHVGMNAYSDSEREANRDFPRWIYNAKHSAHEMSRAMYLFARDREKPDEAQLQCAMGQKCASCPILAHVEKAMTAERERAKFPRDIDDQDVDAAKAWTCIAHILQTNTEVHDGAMFSTKEDRERSDFF